MESDNENAENKNRSFWIGFSLGLMAFVAANIVSYGVEYTAFLAREERPMKFSVGGYSWGFPLTMSFNTWGNPNHVGFELIPTVINIILAFAFAGALGLAFQFIRDRFRSTSA